MAALLDRAVTVVTWPQGFGKVHEVLGGWWVATDGNHKDLVWVLPCCDSALLFLCDGWPRREFPWQVLSLVSCLALQCTTPDSAQPQTLSQMKPSLVTAQLPTSMLTSIPWAPTAGAIPAKL